MKFIALIILTSLAAWYLYYRRQKRQRDKQRLLDLLPQINKARSEFEIYFNGVAYFANYDYQQIKTSQTLLLSQIPQNYAHYGLTDQEFEIIDSFYRLHRDIDEIRAEYNKHFSHLEIEHYRNFFSILEQYPLSEEQMRAVICEEDNNLVIAGAGTGKTTTISAKIAYLLHKKLARPEELLVISFTNAAVEEMYDRTLRFCGKNSGVEEVTFRTFNSFGNLVVRHCTNQPLRIAFDGKDYLVKAFLQQSFDALFLSDDDFQAKAVNFLTFFNRPIKDIFEFNTAAEYRKYQESNRNISMNGLELKSLEEMQIANFLYLHQVDFEYESFFPLKPEDANPDYQHYAPDFYLPGYDIYIEHFGIDKNGDVPSWFKSRPPFTDAKSYYHHGINWKEQIHEKYKTKFVRTYSFQNRDGSLLRSLKQQLIAFGVILKKRNPEQILEKVKKIDDFDGFIGLIYTFLTLMKSAGTSPNLIKPRKKDRRFSVFLDVFTPLYEQYEQKLKSTSSIDFNDMINHATGFIQNGEFNRKYKYILVDEFQDMSQGKYALLSALKTAYPPAKLYCVGDDWQSIFRFAGSDVSVLSHFSKYFGVTAYNSVLQTYRFNTEILNVSSSFIQKNPTQLPKKLHSPFDSTLPAFQLVPLHPKNLKKAEVDHYRFERIHEILLGISKITPRASIFLIGRYNHNRPMSLAALQKMHPQMCIAYHTAHASKGLTCDYAILLGIESGVFGFPSEVADDQVLSYLLQDDERYENAEERRLFYVALTRARHKVFLMYDIRFPSKFIDELKADYDLEMRLPFS